MIPAFPAFKKLEITDRQALEELTKSLPPYSDYNFVSLWSWDTDSTLHVSQLNANLVIRMPDYITGELFYSFVGQNQVDETIRTLLAHAQQTDGQSNLKLIPELAVQHIAHPERFEISEDRDSFDYVIDLVDFVTLEGTKNRTKRADINRYQRHHAATSEIQPLDLTSLTITRQIFDLFAAWEKAQGKDSAETRSELGALQRLLSHAHHFELQALGLYIQGELKGFSIYEVLDNNHGIGHFEKADTSYPGIVQYLKHHAAKNLLSHEVQYFNEEQDLGIAGLRTSKLLHRPHHFLKKYTIALKA